MVEDENMKKITHRNISDWLVGIGMLKVVDKGDGKTTKAPTEMGHNIGISTEVRTGQYGNYEIVVYNRTAQQFIVDNIAAVIDSVARAKAKDVSRLNDDDRRALERVGDKLTERIKMNGIFDA